MEFAQALLHTAPLALPVAARVLPDLFGPRHRRHPRSRAIPGAAARHHVLHPPASLTKLQNAV